LDFGPVESLEPKLCHVGHLEAWGSCLGCGPVESIETGNGSLPPLNIGAEIVLCWGTQRQGVAAWGVARLNPDALEPLRLVKIFDLLDL